MTRLWCSIGLLRLEFNKAITSTIDRIVWTARKLFVTVAAIHHALHIYNKILLIISRICAFIISISNKIVIKLCLDY